MGGGRGVGVCVGVDGCGCVHVCEGVYKLTRDNSSLIIPHLQILLPTWF